MPCNCGHLQPNEYEVESKLISEHIEYVLKKQKSNVPKWIAKAVRDPYGAPHLVANLTVLLCDLCRLMSKQEKEKIIYNGRSTKARKLADWWDEHKCIDKGRNKEEKKKVAQEKLKERALNKLTKQEKAALGL